MLRNRHLLPAATEWVRIEGGNHTQFGCYRFQRGDNQTTISRDEQQAVVMRTLAAVLSQVGPRRYPELF